MMYTREQQALDRFLTGNWGEDDCGPEPVDEAKAIVESVRRLTETLDDNNEDGQNEQVVLKLRKALDYLEAAHDLML
jgi:hypothetical protein